jgi:hypothetical protein
VATKATDCHWAHGVRSIIEEAHNSKLREPPCENEAEPNLAGRCSHQNLDSVEETASFSSMVAFFFEDSVF